MATSNASLSRSPVVKRCADRLFDGKKMHGPETTAVLDAEGHLLGLIPTADAGEGVERVAGQLQPGFVNAHCHLELSHLKDVVPQHTGLVPFLLDIVTKRDLFEERKYNAITAAAREMWDDGIRDVGDICNTGDSIPAKTAPGMRWTNYVEVLSLTGAKTAQNMEHYGQVLEQFLDAGLSNSVLTPHAPYTISSEAFKALNMATEGRSISIHNQETPAEDDLFRTGQSEFLQLFRFFGLEGSPFPVTGKSSIRSWLPFFNRGQRILLVHNTCTTEEDIIWAKEYAASAGISLAYCFCVNANLYIENKLPPLDLFMKHNCEMVLGTDSYSSNTQLKISAEISTIRDRYPSIPYETVLGWAAKAERWVVM